MKKREALPRDGTLWIASHRDSIYNNSKIYSVVKVLLINNDWQEKVFTPRSQYMKLSAISPQQKTARPALPVVLKLKAVS